MARTHEFVGAAVPWHDTAQMGANSVNAIATDGIGSFHDQISGITLQTLDQTAITLRMGT